MQDSIRELKQQMGCTGFPVRMLTGVAIVLSAGCGGGMSSTSGGATKVVTTLPLKGVEPPPVPKAPKK